MMNNMSINLIRYLYSSMQNVLKPVILLLTDEIQITCSTANSIIYYTINGGKPTIADNLYTDMFAVHNKDIIKARAFADGYLPSAVTLFLVVI